MINQWQKTAFFYMSGDTMDAGGHACPNHHKQASDWSLEVEPGIRTAKTTYKYTSNIFFPGVDFLSFNLSKFIHLSFTVICFFL